MRFKITLNMPSYKGNPVHQVFAEHPAETIRDLMEEWRDQGYIIVTELYKQDDGCLSPHEEIAITDMVGAKVTCLRDREA